MKSTNHTCKFAIIRLFKIYELFNENKINHDCVQPVNVKRLALIY